MSVNIFENIIASGSALFQPVPSPLGGEFIVKNSDVLIIYHDPQSFPSLFIMILLADWLQFIFITFLLNLRQSSHLTADT